MPEQQVPDRDVSHVEGDDALRQPGVALVGVGGVFPLGNLAGARVTFPAFCECPFVRAQNLAQGGDLLRVGRQLAESLVKHRDADARDCIKIL